MVMERVSRSEKQWPTEARSFGPELTEAEIDASVEELMILEFLKNSYSTRACWIYIDYFMVGECVRFLFTSCEGSRKRTSERSKRVSLTILHNK